MVPQGSGTMGEHLEPAAALAKAAGACAEARSMEQAMAVPLGIAQVIYEASTLVNAASMMHCIGRS